MHESIRMGIYTVLVGFILFRGSASPAELLSVWDSIANTHADSGPFLGIRITDATSGETLFETNSHRLFIPASNTKLFTAALGLDWLGGHFQFHTTLFSRSPVVAKGHLAGDLVVQGEGDPTFMWDGSSTNHLECFNGLIGILRDRNIRRIQGDLVLDDGWFRDSRLGIGWQVDDIGETYAPVLSALIFNLGKQSLEFIPGGRVGEPARPRIPDPWLDKALQQDAGWMASVVTGPAGSPARIHREWDPARSGWIFRGTLPAGSAVHTEEFTSTTPTEDFGYLLHRALRNSGIEINGRIRQRQFSTRDIASLHLLGRHASAPLESLLPALMKPSDNALAQLLWLGVGATARKWPQPDETRPVPPADMEDSVQWALGRFLNRFNIPTKEVRIFEGSGLARLNLVSPYATVELLRAMEKHPAAEAWLGSMPVGGVDGTLSRRFTDPDVRGKIRAKTGSLRGIHALSGYAESASGRRYVFSILSNQHPGSAAEARAEIDRLITALVR